MGLNLKTFRTRTLTAIVFAVIMLAGLFINHWTFFILFSVVHFGCWYEYQKMVGLIDKEYQDISDFHKYGVRIAGWCIMLYFTNDAFMILGLRLHELGWWLGLMFIFLLPVIELLFAKNVRLKNIAHSSFGLLYISLSCGLMMDLYANPGFTSSLAGQNEKIYEVFLPLFVIGCMWINDTMAYIVGSLIGKTPLSAISPKKTWEGTIGGAILAAGIMGCLAWVMDEAFIYGRSLPAWIIAAMLACIAGTLGDLLESKLKRLASLKDSGALMPGHGGFLDRFDSLLVAIPIVWLYIHFFIK